VCNLGSTRRADWLAVLFCVRAQELDLGCQEVHLPATRHGSWNACAVKVSYRRPESSSFMDR
jgi:hypothetical protein